MGASGAGKSTLLQILRTLSTPDYGPPEIEGTDVLPLTGKEHSDFRNRNIRCVFKVNPILPTFTTMANVMIPPFTHGR